MKDRSVMKYIIIDQGQNGYCIAEVPDHIADDVGHCQALFDQWLWDKNAPHSYRKVLNGAEVMVYDGAAAFMEWLNDNVVEGSDKARIVFDEIPLIHF